MHLNQEVMAVLAAIGFYSELRDCGAIQLWIPQSLVQGLRSVVMENLLGRV